MRTLVLMGLLVQAPAIDLERESLAMRHGSRLAMVTLIASHPDGSPVRGHIQCAGSWFKHEDDNRRVWHGPSLPFETDSRGAVIMNPALADEWIHCWATDRGRRGDVTVDLAGTHVAHIVLEKGMHE